MILNLKDRYMGSFRDIATVFCEKILILDFNRKFPLNFWTTTINSLNFQRTLKMFGFRILSGLKVLEKPIEDLIHLCNTLLKIEKNKRAF